MTDAVDVTHDPARDHEYLRTRRLDESTWEMPVTPAVLNMLGGLYGGAGIAVASAAVETATSRPLRWITCQFVGSAHDGETVRVEVQIDNQGRRISQAHILGTVGQRVVFRAVAATGEPRSDLAEARWVTMPQVPGPEDCANMELEPGGESKGASMEPVERRLADGPDLADFLQEEPRPHGFQMSFWSRMTDTRSASPAMLGWLADIVMMGVVAGTGRAVGGKSLDNTLRMVTRADPDWVLVDLRPVAISDGYAYGDVHLWAPDGRLLATASQTASVRPWDT
jgi:acyl-CoA thioesterase II